MVHWSRDMDVIRRRSSLYYTKWLVQLLISCWLTPSWEAVTSSHATWLEKFFYANVFKHNRDRDSNPGQCSVIQICMLKCCHNLLAISRVKTKEMYLKPLSHVLCMSWSKIPVKRTTWFFILLNNQLLYIYNQFSRNSQVTAPNNWHKILETVTGQTRPTVYTQICHSIDANTSINTLIPASHIGTLDQVAVLRQSTSVETL